MARKKGKPKSVQPAGRRLTTEQIRRIRKTTDSGKPRKANIGSRVLRGRDPGSKNKGTGKGVRGGKPREGK